MSQQVLSLFELNRFVKQALHNHLPDTYWVQAELSDVRSNSSGHCYLEFVQKDTGGNHLIAKARGTIWSNIFKMLKPYFEQETPIKKFRVANKSTLYIMYNLYRIKRCSYVFIFYIIWNIILFNFNIYYIFYCSYYYSF